MFNTLTCTAKNVIKSATNIHHPDGRPDVFIFSTPRSGSTWLMELIWTQPGFKACNEPLDVRNPMVQRYSGLTTWQELYDAGAEPVLRRYFQAICSGRLHALDYVRFREQYRLVTHRIVFKMIQGCEERINWFRDTFNGQIVYLIRHPIAVGISREYFPRLQAQLQSQYRQHFSQEQLDLAQHILEHGSKLERGVLAWCLENAVPLRMATPDWLIVAYEDLILDPQPLIVRLAQHLNLPEPQRMLDRLTVPSAVKAKSNRETQQALEQGTDRRWLIGKWRKHVTEQDERRAMDILAHFQIDMYQYGEFAPVRRGVVNHPAQSPDHQARTHLQTIGETP